MDRYDLIIIGTGAGGGTLLSRLAPTGKRILVLERGGFLPREKENWSTRAVFLESRYKAAETWFDGDGRPFHPGTHYAVGGNTKVYGAALLRFRERDFAALPHFGGVSPEWPLSYRDFAPYYLEAERLYQVHGLRGSDPTEPPCADPYPWAPVSHEPRIQELHDDFLRLGLNPFPLPLGVRLDEKDRAASPCIRCQTCDGFPCLVDAKSDAQVTCVQPALRHPNVTLLTGARVERLVADGGGGAVTRVVVDRDGRREEYAADVFVVSCGAVNSAALLLRSADERHPRGLANRSDVVGRHYMCHNNSALLAISKRDNPTVFQKTLALNDFYFGSEEEDLPLGHIQMLGKSDHEMLKQEAPPLVPKAVLDTMARHALDFWITSEDLPDPDNRVTVRPDGSIGLAYAPNNEEGHRRLVGRLKGMLRQIGCEESKLFPKVLYLGKKIPLAGVAHQCGTVRFGRDPETSALDVHCKAHDLDNLYVVDASFFVSSTAVNPALTIMANALRVGDHLKARFGWNGNAAS